MTALKPLLAEEALRALLATVLPSWDGALTPLAGGGTARVYTLEQGGTPLILRLSAIGESFAKDAHAAAQFAGPGLPIPAMLAWGQAAEDVLYALTRRAPGTTLSTLPPERQQALAPAVLDLLDRIHGIGGGDERVRLLEPGRPWALAELGLIPSVDRRRRG